MTEQELAAWAESLRAARNSGSYEHYLELLAPAVVPDAWLAGVQVKAEWHAPADGIYAWLWVLPGDVVLGCAEWLPGVGVPATWHVTDATM